MIKIALTKGRIEKNIQELLGNIGYDIRPIINKDRKLVVDVGDEIQIVFVKSVDVVNLVNSGVVDLGIVGSDTIYEKPSEKYSQILDFETGKCFFALCALPSYGEIPAGRVKKIATKYPNITKTFFDKKEEKIEIVELHGSVEIGPLMGLSDAIVDIVETGDTLRANGLSIIEPVGMVSTRLIGNNERIQEKNKEIGDFVEKIQDYKSKVRAMQVCNSNR